MEDREKVVHMSVLLRYKLHEWRQQFLGVICKARDARSCDQVALRLQDCASKFNELSLHGNLNSIVNDLICQVKGRIVEDATSDFGQENGSRDAWKRCRSKGMKTEYATLIGSPKVLEIWLIADDNA